MALRKRYLRLACHYALFLAFCFVYRFLIAGRRAENAFMDMTDYTVNTTSYLNYVHTATFYTVFYTALLGESLTPARAQNLIRMTRNALFLRNTLAALICAAVYSALFCLPQLVFMRSAYPTSELAKIGFTRLLLIQLCAYALYFAVTGLLMLAVYYHSLDRVLAQTATVGANTAAMFAYRLLNLTTPIEQTLVFTKCLNLGMPAGEVLAQVLLLLIPAAVFAVAGLVILNRRDILD